MTLPAGWTHTTLGELGRYINGRGFKKSEWGVAGRPIIRIQNLTGSGSSFNYYDGPVEDRYVVRDGDLLVSWAATLGAYVWRGPEALLNQHIFRVESNIDREFHKYLLDFKLQELMRHTHGSGIVHITKGKFDSVPVALPPFQEQRRIVEILDAHLSRLDAAAADLARVDQRTRALELAFVSALVRDARTVRVPLADLLDVSIGGVWGSAPGEDECDVDVLRVTELRARGRLDSATSARRSVTQKVLTSRHLEPGDLLLEKSGGGPKQPVGRVGLVGELRGPSVCSNFMQLMRPRRSLVEPGFLHLYLNALHQSGGTSHMQRASTNIRNIKASEYMALEVPVPDLEAQRSGLASARSSATEVDRLRSVTEATQRRSSALRKTLLAAAFSGRLTSPNLVDDIKELAGV